MKGTTVFVVDDEEIIAMSLAKILTMSGYEAKFFTNPLKALAEITDSEPSLLITDVMMPGLLGTDLAVLVKERNRGCKILLLSGNAATSDLLVKAKAAGHDFILLSKPLHPAELLAKLRQTS